MSRVICLLLSITFMLQSVAFAVEPLEMSKSSLEVQIAMKNAGQEYSSRFNKLSEVKKLKFLNRQEKRLLKIQKKLSKMSAEKFERVKLRMEMVLEKSDELSELSGEESDIYAQSSPQDHEAVNDSLKKLKRSDLEDKFSKALAEIKIVKSKVADKIAKKIDDKARGIASDKSCALSWLFIVGGIALFFVGFFGIFGLGLNLLAVVLGIPLTTIGLGLPEELCK